MQAKVNFHAFWSKPPAILRVFILDDILQSFDDSRRMDFFA